MVKQHPLSNKAFVQGIILDLDDTLYLERDYVYSGFLAVGRQLSSSVTEAKCYGEWLWKRSLQCHDGHVFNHFLEAFPHLNTLTSVEKMVKCYRTHNPDIELSPEWLSFLAEWRQRGVFIGMISDGDVTGQRQKVKALGLKKYFDHIILTDQLGREYWKPHHRAFLEIQQVSGLNSDALVYVGDNVLKDFLAPNVLGWRTVRLRVDQQVRANLEPEDKFHASQHDVHSVQALKEIFTLWLAEGVANV